ncbi:MAG: glycerol-3-phosphate dehydrogenase/oxidase [Granulosicoccus sp.]
MTTGMAVDERRATLIEDIAAADIDVLIIGGGINGVSTFRELAINGVSAVLVDRQDFCAGTSAAPSRLIHGGIKYLENGEFRLVAESTLERNRLLHNAAHLVKPLPCTVPFHSYFGGLFKSAIKFLRLPVKGFSKRGLVVVKIGMMIYDWMGRKQRLMPTHTTRGAKESHEMFGALDPQVVATGTYYDALVTQPERLCMEIVNDTLHDVAGNNAACLALSYASVVEQDAEQVVIRDELQGTLIKIQPRLVVNAAGPWIDKVNALLNVDSHYIGGSKGSHLILDHTQLQASLNGHMLYFETGDNRLCLAYPTGDRVLIGATDILVDDPDTAKCEEDEVDYLISAMATLLPGIPVTREHIVYRYSGVRPLPFSDGLGVGSVSRDHSIEVDEATTDRPFAVASLIGGKWTTFRAFGEVAADLVMNRIGVERSRNTHNLAIGGGRDLPSDDERGSVVMKLSESLTLEADIIEELIERYGYNLGLLEMVACDDGACPLGSLASYRVGEFRYMCEKEMVVHLDDIVFRRSTLALEGRASDAVIAEIASVVAPVLGWDNNHRQSEIDRCQRLVKDPGRVVAPV